MHENLPHFVIQAKFLRRILRLYWQPLSNIFYRNIQGLSSVSFNPVAKIQDSSSQTLTKIRHSSEDATLPNLYCDKHINNVVKPTIRPIVVRNLSNLGTEKVSNNIISYNRSALSKPSRMQVLTKGYAAVTSSVMTKENCAHYLSRLQTNNANLIYLEIGFALNNALQQQLLSAIQNNKVIGNIVWHANQQQTDTIQLIDHKLITNNEKYLYYPSDYIHGLLSAHTYKIANIKTVTLNDPILNKLLDGWRVLRKFEDSNGYCGVIYSNEKDHQLVVAFKGTDVALKELLKCRSSFYADVEGVVKSNIIPHHSEAYKTIKYACDLAQGQSFHLSLTGHSLGAWFAEIGLYFCHNDFRMHSAKAVTFDSPGSLEMIERLKPNIAGTEIVEARDLNIVTYLAPPNPINSCKRHAGNNIYQVFPSLSLDDFLKNELGLAENIRQSLVGLTSLEGHILARILEQFNPKTGKPDNLVKVLDWPTLKYNPNMHRSDNFWESMFNLISDWVDGKFNNEQYWSIFRNLQFDEYTPNVMPGSKGGSEFLLKYESHFRRDSPNLYKTILSLALKNDRFLIKLWKARDTLNNAHNIPKNLQIQLISLAAKYKVVEPPPLTKLLPELHTVNIVEEAENIKRIARRLLEVSPSLYDKVEFLEYSQNLNGINHVNRLHTQPVPKSEQYILNTNLERVPYYIKTTYYQQLSDLLGKSTVVIIHGMGGMGKTALATEYAAELQEADCEVKFLKADALKEEFLMLANDIGVSVKTLDLNSEEVRDRVYKQISQFKGLSGHMKQVLLIFDRVQSDTHIEFYLKNLPSNIRILITTRSDQLSYGKSIRLQGFQKSEAISYVRQAKELDIITAAKLVEIVGFSPFRLKCAISYLKMHNLMTTEQYAAEYNLTKKSKSGDDKIYPEVDMLFRDIIHDSEAWDLLGYIAFLDENGAPLKLLENAMSKPSRILQPHVNILHDSSLLNVVHEEGMIILKISHQIVKDEFEKCIIETGYHRRPEMLKKLINATNMLCNEKVRHLSHQGWSSYSLSETLLLSKNLKTLLAESRRIPSFGEIFAQAHQSLGDLFYILGGDTNIEEGINHLKESLKIQKSLYKEFGQSNDISITQTLTSLGNAYYALGRENNIRMGLEYSLEALDIRMQICPALHPDIAVSCNNVGKAYIDLGGIENNEKGLMYLQKALEIRKKNYNNKEFHFDVADSLINVGWALIKMPNSKDATKAEGEAFLLEALRIVQDSYQDNHPAIAMCFHQLGSLYGNMIGQDMNEKSLPYLDKALKMRQSLYHGNHPDIANSLNCIGAVIFSLGGESNTNTALEFFRQSLRMCEALFNSNHYEYASVLVNTGIAYCQLGGEQDIHNGIILLKKGLKMAQELPNHDMTVLAVNRIALAYANLSGAHNKRESFLYQGQCASTLQYLGKDKNVVAQLHFDTGIGYLSLNHQADVVQGIRHLRTALQIWHTIPNSPNSSLYVARTLYYLGKGYDQLFDRMKALEYFKQAYSVMSIMGSDSDPVKKMREEIALYDSDSFKDKTPSFAFRVFFGNNKNIHSATGSRFIIPKSGVFEEKAFAIAQLIREKTILTIQQIAANGKKPYSNVLYGTEQVLAYYFTDKHLQEYLGSDCNAASLEIARMLCFEAMNIGLMQAATANTPYYLLQDFTRMYPDLVKKIAECHPEYFVDGSLVEVCIMTLTENAEFAQCLRQGTGIEAKKTSGLLVQGLK